MKRARFIICLIISVYIIGCQATYEDGYEMAEVAKKIIKEITIDSLFQKIDRYDSYLLIDIRQPEEFAEDNIPGSVSIPRGELEFKIMNESFWEEMFLYTPEKSEEIIVYCNGGNRGALSAETLQKLGFKNVYSIKGGLKAYNEENKSSELEQLK